MKSPYDKFRRGSAGLLVLVGGSALLGVILGLLMGPRRLPVLHCSEADTAAVAWMDLAYKICPTAPADSAVAQWMADSVGKGQGSRDPHVDTTAGARSPQAILVVIKSHIGEFKAIYEKYLRDDTSLAGKLSLKFTVSPKGRIVRIEKVSSTLHCTSLDRDIMEKAKQMDFGAIDKGNATITYAFVFQKE